MADDTFNIGDEVFLKSGGPVMVVTDIDGKFVQVQMPTLVTYPAECLTHTNPETVHAG